MISFFDYNYKTVLNKKRRFLIRPGITGLAQIRVRNNATWDERIKIDIEYVDNITFAKDVKIIIDTIVKTIKRENIYNEATTNKENVNEKEKLSV